LAEEDELRGRKKNIPFSTGSRRLVPDDWFPTTGSRRLVPDDFDSWKITSFESLAKLVGNQVCCVPTFYVLRGTSFTFI